MGVKRRAFLIGSAAVIGGGIFALQYGDYAARRDGLALTRRDKAGSFTGWLRIGQDDRVTLYTPHIDMGTGNATAKSARGGVGGGLYAASGEHRCAALSGLPGRNAKGGGSGCGSTPFAES